MRLKKTTKNIISAQLIIMIAIFCFYLAYFMIKAQKLTHDDSFYFNTIQNNNLLQYFTFAKDRYFDWTGRFIIEFFIAIFIERFFLWQVVSAVACSIISIYPAYLLSIKPKPSLILLNFSVSLLLSPVFIFETGWIATSLNYLWPISASFIALTPIIRNLRDKSTGRLLMMLSYFLFFFAVNQEQLAGCLFLLLCLFLVVFLCLSKKVKVLIPFFVMNLISLILLLASPGSAVRNQTEVERWFPEFKTFSFFRKIELGFSSSGQVWFFSGSLLILVLLLLLFAIYWTKHDFSIGFWCDSVLLLIWCMFGPLNSFFKTQYPFIQRIEESFTKFGTTFQLKNPSTWLTDFLLISIIALLIFSIILLPAVISPLEKTIAVSLLSIGFISRWILGFSPTVWASGQRITFVGYVFVLCTIIYLYYKSKLDEYSKPPVWLLTSALSVVGALNFFFSY